MNLWHVVRVDTPNGKRIGIAEATEADGMDTLTKNSQSQAPCFSNGEKIG